MPKISIIIPLHNAEAYILETLQSCLNQSYLNIEVIVVENGSTDNSFEIVETFASEKVKLYKIGKASAPIARNFGLTKTTGEYIQYLDADDILHKDKIRLQMELLQPLDKNSIVSGQWYKFENNIEEAVVKPQKVWKDYDKPLQWLVDSWSGGGMMQTGCWLAHKSLIEAAGTWNEELQQNPNDDGEFFCRVLLNASKIRYVEESKVYYRIPSSTNVSENRSKVAVSSLLGSFYSYQKEILKINDSRMVRIALAYNYSRFIYEFYPHYKELIEQAQAQIKTFELINPIVGGKKFKKLARFIGFNNALINIGIKRLYNQTLSKKHLCIDQINASS